MHKRIFLSFFLFFLYFQICIIHHFLYYFIVKSWTQHKIFDYRFYCYFCSYLCPIFFIKSICHDPNCIIIKQNISKKITIFSLCSSFTQKFCNKFCFIFPHPPISPLIFIFNFLSKIIFFKL